VSEKKMQKTKVKKKTNTLWKNNTKEKKTKVQKKILEKKIVNSPHPLAYILIYYGLFYSNFICI
jgi:hypothetical protein